MYRFLLVDDEINVSKALRRLLLNTAIAPISRTLKGSIR